MASGAYEDAKNFVVINIANGITATGVIQCNEECRAIIKQGLEAVLAYCGIPPNIPTTGELYGQGLEYLATNLAQMAVEQTIGLDVPSDPAAAGVYETKRKAIYEASYQASKDGISAFAEKLGCPNPQAPDCGVVADNPYTWGSPDPYLRAHPGFMYFKVERKPQADATTDELNWLEVKIEGEAYDGFKIPVASIAPGSSIVVPVALWPKNPGQWKEYGRITKYDCFTGSLPTCGQPLYYAPKMQLTVATIHKASVASADESQWLRVEWPNPSFSAGSVFDGIDGNPKAGANALNGGKNYFGEITAQDCP
jgi:hypothetical protein